MFCPIPLEGYLSQVGVGTYPFKRLSQVKVNPSEGAIPSEDISVVSTVVVCMFMFLECC